MLLRYFIFAFSLITSISTFAQKDVYLNINHKLGVQTFGFGKSSVNDMGFKFSVDRIDYYVSRFVIIHDGGQKINLPDSMIILARGDKNVIHKLGNFDVTNVEGIGFSIGVPITYNNLDPTSYNESSPLAPQSPSMHWGWAAGYRFVALEGKAGDKLNIDYQIHGLGNKNYFSQIQMAKGVVSGDDIYINLDADFDKALKGVNVSKGPIDHGANTSDLMVLWNFRDFVFSPSTGTSSTFDADMRAAMSVYPNPSHGEVFIDGKGVEYTTSKVYDLNGKLVKSITANPSIINKVAIDAKGVYFIILENNSTIKHIQKVIID